MHPDIHFLGVCLNPHITDEKFKLHITKSQIKGTPKYNKQNQQIKLDLTNPDNQA
jgi:hypothetical protein